MVNRKNSRLSWPRRVSLAGLVALMTVGGTMHFFATQSYVEAVPRFLPLRRELVYGSGIVEILCGLSLIPRRTRPTGAWITVVVLALIFPANVQMALEGPRPGSGFPFNSQAALWIRLPLQGLFIAWAYSFSSERKDEGEEKPSGPS